MECMGCIDLSQDRDQWRAVWTFGLHEMLGSCRVATPQERLESAELHGVSAEDMGNTAWCQITENSNPHGNLRCYKLLPFWAVTGGYMLYMSGLQVLSLVRLSVHYSFQTDSDPRSLLRIYFGTAMPLACLCGVVKRHEETYEMLTAICFLCKTIILYRYFVQLQNSTSFLMTIGLSSIFVSWVIYCVDVSILYSHC
jgi:hypothetical protein